MRILKIFLLVISGLISLDSFAQKSITSNKVLMEKEIMKIIARNNAHNIIKDSIALYSFNFKLKITKNKDNKIKINQLLVSDPLLYKICPNYKKLYNIDYKFLLTNRNQVTLIIPIVIANTANISTSEFERQRGEPLVAIKPTLRIIEKAILAMASDDNQWNENVVIATPIPIEIYKIQ